MLGTTDMQIFSWLTNAKPAAMAEISGSRQYPKISGTLKLYQTNIGVFAVLAVENLPASSDKCSKSIFAAHIHNGSGCSDSGSEPFPMSGTHYNPNDCEHPYHAGDMPPLFSADGSAWIAFLTDRFRVSEVIGLPVVIHMNKDDFTTQPSGNAGAKIACGVIKAVR